jgi:CpeT protein
MNTVQADRSRLDSPALWPLAQCIAGEFSNQQQAFDHPTQFAHIRIFFRPLPFEFFGTIGFYSEQVYDYDLWLPYRQGIHRLVAQEDGAVYIENYGIKNALRYAGSGRDLNILRSITPAMIDRRCNCSMVFRPEAATSDKPSHFVGAVEPGNNCLIPKDGKLTYLVSEVELTELTWVSRDRGFDPQTHEYVWGSEHGPLSFTKVQSFAHELVAS